MFIIEVELTHKDLAVATITKQRLESTVNSSKRNFPLTDISIAPGLWPLGRSYEDKSARMSPSQFEEVLRTVFSVAPDYVWIYGFGSAWQTGGPYGEAKVTKRFRIYGRTASSTGKLCKPAPGWRRIS